MDDDIITELYENYLMVPMDYREYYNSILACILNRSTNFTSIIISKILGISPMFSDMCNTSKLAPTIEKLQKSIKPSFRTHIVAMYRYSYSKMSYVDYISYVESSLIEAVKMYNDINPEVKDIKAEDVMKCSMDTVNTQITSIIGPLFGLKVTNDNDTHTKELYIKLTGNSANMNMFMNEITKLLQSYINEMWSSKR